MMRNGKFGLGSARNHSLASEMRVASALCSQASASTKIKTHGLPASPHPLRTVLIGLLISRCKVSGEPRQLGTGAQAIHEQLQTIWGIISTGRAAESCI
jgi:hypothetical protein